MKNIGVLIADPHEYNPFCKWATENGAESFEENGMRMLKMSFCGDRLVAMLHPQATIAFESIDPAIITRLSEEDIIDRFLLRGDYRIVAEDGDADDISKLENEEDEDMVSEELAEIYEKQGLYDEAIATYRKLSLLNSEKSIYFAELIAKIEAIKCGKR